MAILTPVGDLRRGAAFASQIALTSIEAIHLNEGCHILGRNVFLPEKVPHVSRQHLKLDVRPGEIEITVVRVWFTCNSMNVTLCNHSSGATAGTVEVGLLDPTGCPTDSIFPTGASSLWSYVLTNAGV
jgi:hypothetical protein